MNNIIMVKIEDLKSYENNARNNTQAIPIVERSIKEFGFTNPILIDKNNVIVGGHTRLEASKNLGYSEVPCIKLESLTDTQIKAYRLVDNKTSEIATWEYEILSNELETLEVLDYSLVDFGFNMVDTDLDITDDMFLSEEEHEEKEKVKKYCKNCGAEI